MERGLEGEEERKAISVFPPDHLKQINALTETAETYLVSALFFIPRKRPREKGRGIEKERGTVSWPKWRGRWNLTEEKIDFLGWDLGVIGKQREGGERGGVSNTHRQYRPVNIHLLDHNNKMQRERERERQRENIYSDSNLQQPDIIHFQIEFPVTETVCNVMCKWAMTRYNSYQWECGQWSTAW